MSLSGRNNQNGYAPQGEGLSPELTDQLLNAVQTSVIFLSPDGTIRRINDRAAKELHLTADSIGSRLCDVLTVMNQGKDLLPELLESVIGGAKEAAFPPDTFLRTPIGGVRFFAEGRFTGLYVDGALTTIVFSYRNVVSELTQEYMLKMALSSTKIFPWYYDMERNVMVIDQRYFAYTGIQSPDNTLSLERYTELLHPDDRALMAHAFSLQLSGNHYPYPVPFRVMRGDGRYEWFEGQSTYLGQVDGFPYRIVGICMSTQAHKDIEESLTAARDKAQQSDRLKSAFLANMSHEIRTPLNAIVGFSNLLTGGEIEPGSEEACEYVSIINMNCTHLLNLISDILDLSRIETDTMEYSFSEQSLTQLLSDTYQSHRLNIPQGVVMELAVPPQEAVVQTDPVRLRQVMDNLLNNAVKFTPQGRVCMGYRVEDADTVELFVEDSGIGIPADKRNAIFERFYKIDTFTQGAGLGLSICKTIVEQLGGAISVESHPGGGSRFSVRIPVRPTGKD